MQWNPDLNVWVQLKGAISAIFRIAIGVQIIRIMKGFEITVPDMKASPYMVVVYQILNPSSGGTGSFILQTRRNQAYLVDTNLVDYNYAFGQVGVIPTAVDFASIVVSSASPSVNGVGDYTITFSTSTLIPGTGSVVLDFGPSTLILAPNVTASTSLSQSANITQVNKKITINNLGSDIPINSYSLTIKNVQNPSYAGVPGQVILQSWSNATNSIINQRKAIMLPSIQSGLIANPTTTVHATLGQPEALSVGDVVVFQVAFNIQNQISQTGTIILLWLVGGLQGSCIITSGLYDISQSIAFIISSLSAQMVTCTNVGGNKFTVVNFKQVQANTLITCQFTALTPLTAGPITTHMNITTYQDQALTQTIDTYDAQIGLVVLAYPQLSSFVVGVAPPQASQLATWTVKFYHSVAFTTGGSIVLKFPPQFTITALTCVLVTNAGLTDNGSCSVANQIVTILLGSQASNFNTARNQIFVHAVPNTLTLSTIQSPTIATSYPIGVSFLNGATIIGRQTVYLNVLPQVLSGLSLFRLTSNKDRPTLFMVTFAAPQQLQNGLFKADFNAIQSVISVEFETANQQFPLDLGTGLASGSNIPCYGTGKLSGVDVNTPMTCTIRVPLAAPAPAVIIVKNFQAVLQGYQLVLHLPNIKNPYCQVAVTNDILCPTSAHLTVKIWQVQGRKPYILYQSSSLDPVLILAPVLPQTATGNLKNTAMPDGSTSNPTPTFQPNTINVASTTNIRYQPSINKYLPSVVTNHMILIYPLLPTTVPQAYMLPLLANMVCNIGLSEVQKCYAYREVGWIVILGLTEAIPTPPSLEITFSLTGFTNPFYAADPNGFLTIITVAGQLEVENTLYQKFVPYTPGTVSQVRITGLNYEANLVDVEYSWIFSLNDNIPAGGFIDLIFPKNYYNVQQSVPTPTFQVYLGLVSVRGQFLSTTDQTTNVNIYSLQNFLPYQKGTLISVKVRGVKNPSVAGQTNYFEIKSRTQESYTIDYKSDIPQIIVAHYVRIIQILRPLASGQIQFLGFTMSPINGSPGSLLDVATDANIFPGDYQISFYPTRDIPQNGYIEITFPATEFTNNSFLNVPLRCYVSGSVTTFVNCTLAAGTTIITMMLDTPMKVEPGMLPIQISIPNVRNFKEDLSSGVLVIRTLYDGVVLDESGTTDLFRKATTGPKALYMQPSQFQLAFAPTNEGQLASFSITLRPLLPINYTATIRIDFPKSFPQGLGGLVACNIPALQKSSNDPIQCVVQGYSVVLSNFAAYQPSGSGFVVLLSSVRNPNAGTYTSGFRVFIMSTAASTQEFVANLGSMTFIAAPAILYMPYLNCTSPNTRVYADYQFDLVASYATSFTQLQIDYQEGYQIEELWSTKQLINYLVGGSPSTATVIKNSLMSGGTYSVVQGQYFSVEVLAIPNPMDEGILAGYPIVSLYDVTTSSIKMKTYHNLDQYLTPDFENAGALIIIGDDNPIIYIEAGTYTNDILLSITSRATQDILVTPLYDASFKDLVTFTAMLIKLGAVSSHFRIGLDSSVSVLQITVKFTHAAKGYIPVRPVQIYIQRNKNTTVTLTAINTVPAGGRSSVQMVQMLNAPYRTMRFTFEILNNLPTDSDVYPQWIEMSNGTQSGKFWVSAGPNTLGVQGSLLVLSEGADRAIFQLTQRLINFTIVNPSLILPFIVAYNFTNITMTNATFHITVSKDFTFYFFVGPPCVRPVHFEDIRLKELPYDFFNYPFVFGEYVDDQPLHNYSIPISGLTNATQYVMYAYVQDFDGNLANTNLTIPFQTPGFVDPLSDNLTTLANLSIIHQSPTTLVVGQFSATDIMHAIAIRQPRYIFPNNYHAPAAAVRQLLVVNKSTTQNSITHNSKSNSSNNSTHNSSIVNTQLSEEDEQGCSAPCVLLNIVQVIESSNLIAPYSTYACTTSRLNNLTIACKPSGKVHVNEMRMDVYAVGALIAPSGLQVSRGEDSDGILVQHYARSNSSTTITFTDLEPGSDYYIYVAVQKGGSFQRTAQMIIGTTHTLFVRSGGVVLVLQVIALLLSL